MDLKYKIHQRGFMKKNNNKYAIYISGFISLCSINASNATESVVQIDLSTQYYIGNTSELERNKFFNLHSTGDETGLDEIDRRFILDELNAGYGRQFWGPMAVSKTSEYPTTQTAMVNGAKNIENAQASANYVYASNRTVMTEHPKSVITDGNDPIDGARWAADYFEHYFAEDKRPLFYEPMNEPFVHTVDFVGSWDAEENRQMRIHMSNWFKEIGKEFDARGIPTSVIGFSSAWPSFELNDFSHWNSRQKLFMDIAGDYMDAFSFHLYDGVNVTGQDNFRSGSNAEAIIDLIESYSYAKWGEVKQHAVTEYGGIVQGYPAQYSDEKSSQELRSYNHILFSLLSREDRILTSVPFITGSSKWFYEANDFNPYSATVFRPDPEKIISGKVNGLLPTEKAKFYQLWSEVKGHRIHVSNNDPDVAVQAFVYGNKLYVALNNYEDEAKDIALEFVEQAQSASSVLMKRLNVPQHQAAIYSQETLVSAPSNLTLADHETVILEYTYPTTIKHEQQSRKTSYYTDAIIQPIVENSPINVAISDVLLKQGTLTFSNAISELFPFDADYIPYEFEVDQTQYQEYLAAFFKQTDSEGMGKSKNHDDDRDDDDRDEKLEPEEFEEFLEDQLTDKKLIKALVSQYKFEYKNKRELAKFEKSFAKVLKKQGEGWSSSKAYAKLVKKALKSKTLKAALHNHYQANGYNDGVGNATLRLSISRKHDKSKQPQVVINGHSISVPNDWKGYDQVERADFFGTIEISVPVKFLKEDNELSISFADTQGFVSSVILDVEVMNPIEVIAVESITFNTDSLSINKDKVRRLNVDFYPANATNKRLIWTSTDTAAATIDSNGLITPVAPGSTTIQATSEDGEFVASVHVEVKDQLSLRNTIAMTNPPTDLDPTDTLSIDLAYSSDIQRDVSIELYSPQNQWLGLVKQTVPAGDGEVTLVLSFAENLKPGNGYRLISSLKAVDGDWRTSVDGHTISNMNIKSPVVDTDPTLLAGINYDFEFGDLSHWNISGAGSAYVDVAEQGTNDIETGEYGLFIDTTAGPVNVVLAKDVINATFMKPGKKLKMSFDVKRIGGSAGGVGGQRYLAGLDQNSAWAWTGGEWWWTSAPVGNWQHVEVFIDGQDWQDLQTYLFISFATQGEQFYLDNVKLEDISPDGNLLGLANTDFEEGTFGMGVQARQDEGQTNFAYFDIRETAAITGNYGLYIDSTDGDFRLQFSPDAIAHDQVDSSKEYALTFDLKVISGNARLFYNPKSSGTWVPLPGWGTYFNPSEQIVNISVPVSTTDLTPDGTYFFNLHMSPGVIANIDNIRLAPIN